MIEILTSADINREVLQQLITSRGMANFRVSLDTKNWPLLVSNRSKGRVCSCGDGAKPLGKVAQTITMGHVLITRVSENQLREWSALENLRRAYCLRYPQTACQRGYRSAEERGPRGRTRAVLLYQETIPGVRRGCCIPQCQRRRCQETAARQAPASRSKRLGPGCCHPLGRRDRRLRGVSEPIVVKRK